MGVQLRRAALVVVGLVASLTASAAETLEYIHTDAMGSPVAVTDANGVVIERMVYEPYGAVVGGTVKDGPGYTGHVADSATGLSYMQQRYMDPEIGALLGVDPVTAYQQPVVQFGRYRYANGNPYAMVDPDGRSSVNFFSQGGFMGNGQDPLFDSATRFDIPGMTTVMGHSWSTGFRDDRAYKPGAAVTYDNLTRAIAISRQETGTEGYIFLGGCNLGVGSVPSRLAKDFGTNVISSAWFVRRQESNAGDITYTSNTKPDGSGEARWFHMTTPDGRSSGKIGSVTMRSDGKVTFRGADAPTGTRIKPSITIDIKEKR